MTSPDSPPRLKAKKTPKKKTAKIGFETSTVRLGELKAAAEERVEAEQLKNISVLIRTAVRLYLADADKSDLVHLEKLADEIRGLRYDFSRIGGNLNQMAMAFNQGDVLSESLLRVNHEILQKDFKNLSSTMKEILNVIEVFRR